MKTNQNWKAPPGRPRATRRRNQKHCHPVRRVTRPARGAVFLKISLTRHRAFRDGYPLFRDTMLKLIDSPNLEYKQLTAKVQDAA